MTGKNEPLVLAISPSPRGFAFVLFCNRTEPIDWGVKNIPGSRKNARCLGEIRKLLTCYRPETVVLEASTGRDAKRGPRIRALLGLIVQLAKREHAVVKRYTRAEVRRTFETVNAFTRPEIARAIATIIPAFTPKLPPLRKIWMSEDPKQSLFDAAALGLAFYKYSSGINVG